ncbi:unnamed protein product [Cuscuta epithymum]|uniref:Pentatricopeptide repeat-containing protein n=1 Tax=Cuscuta epithymum TaxID=186058 RepID=A0AAV0C1I2_9ASTE|nr:unnamed protein product [Cuscuta epithymum]
MKHASYLFEKIPEPNVAVWNTMIKSFSEAGSPRNAVSLYLEMLRNNVKPDDYTYPFLLKGFTRKIPMTLGKGLHSHVCKFGFNSNEFVNHSLIHIYFMWGNVHMARSLFDHGANTNVMIWNVMVSGLNKYKMFKESRRLFYEMDEKGIMPTAVTLVSSLSAFSKLNDLDSGKRVHQYVKDLKVESNLILDNALMNMYACCGEIDSAIKIFLTMKQRDVISWTTIVTGFISSGDMDLARKYFDKMPERDSVSWTAMIDGYIKENRFKDVLILLRGMQTENLKPDEFTIVSVITACSHVGALELGEWVRNHLDKNTIKFDLHIGNALIDMYFKCGDVEKGVDMFNRLSRRDKFTWTAMIVGLAVNGHGLEALDIFSQMLKSSEKPDDVTFVGVLSACAHTGMVEEGRNFFNKMKSLFGIEPNITHYGCLVDLLGRAGQLTEALKVIKCMPLNPNPVVWGALLAACRVHKDAEMAEMAAGQLLEIGAEKGSVYILLCDVYAACEKWESLRWIRRRMRDEGITKTAGCSSLVRG